MAINAGAVALCWCAGLLGVASGDISPLREASCCACEHEENTQLVRLHFDVEDVRRVEENRPRDNSSALIEQGEALDDAGAVSGAGAPARLPVGRALCPNLLGNVYEERVSGGESVLWTVQQATTEVIGFEPHPSPCGQFVARCGSTSEEFRGFVYGDFHLHMAKYLRGEMVSGTRPFNATVLQNGSILSGKTVLKKLSFPPDVFRPSSQSDVLAVRETLQRLGVLESDNATAVQASARTNAYETSSDPGKFTLLRAPPRGPAFIKLLGVVKKVTPPCNLFTDKVIISGLLFGEEGIVVRSARGRKGLLDIKFRSSNEKIEITKDFSIDEQYLKHFKFGALNATVKVLRSMSSQGVAMNSTDSQTEAFFVISMPWPSLPETIITIYRYKRWLHVLITNLSSLGLEGLTDIGLTPERVCERQMANAGLENNRTQSGRR